MRLACTHPPLSFSTDDSWLQHFRPRLFGKPLLHRLQEVKHSWTKLNDTLIFLLVQDWSFRKKSHIDDWFLLQLLSFTIFHPHENLSAFVEGEKGERAVFGVLKSWQVSSRIFNFLPEFFPFFRTDVTWCVCSVEKAYALYFIWKHMHIAFMLEEDSGTENLWIRWCMSSQPKFTFTFSRDFDLFHWDQIAALWFYFLSLDHHVYWILHSDLVTLEHYSIRTVTNTCRKQRHRMFIVFDADTIKFPWSCSTVGWWCHVNYFHVLGCLAFRWNMQARTLSIYFKRILLPRPCRLVTGKSAA